MFSCFSIERKIECYQNQKDSIGHMAVAALCSNAIHYLKYVQVLVLSREVICFVRFGSRLKRATWSIFLIRSSDFKATNQIGLT